MSEVKDEEAVKIHVARVRASRALCRFWLWYGNPTFKPHIFQARNSLCV